MSDEEDLILFEKLREGHVVMSTRKFAHFSLSHDIIFLRLQQTLPKFRRSNSSLIWSGFIAKPNFSNQLQTNDNKIT